MVVVISVSSIRGGVGKSSLSLELSLTLSTKGKVLFMITNFMHLHYLMKLPLELKEKFYLQRVSLEMF